MKVLKWVINVDNLKNILRHKNLSQKELAKQLRVHPMTITAWCNGRNQPTEKTFDELVNLLGVSDKDLRIWLPTAEQQINLTDTEKKDDEAETDDNPNEEDDSLQEMIRMALQLLSLINDYQMLRKHSQVKEDTGTLSVLARAKIKLLEHIKELEEQNLKK